MSDTTTGYLRASFGSRAEMGAGAGAAADGAVALEFLARGEDDAVCEVRGVIRGVSRGLSRIVMPGTSEVEKPSCACAGTSGGRRCPCCATARRRCSGTSRRRSTSSGPFRPRPWSTEGCAPTRSTIRCSRRVRSLVGVYVVRCATATHSTTTITFPSRGYYVSSRTEKEKRLGKEKKALLRLACFLELATAKRASRNASFARRVFFVASLAFPSVLHRKSDAAAFPSQASAARTARAASAVAPVISKSARRASASSASASAESYEQSVEDEDVPGETFPFLNASSVSVASRLRHPSFFFFWRVRLAGPVSREKAKRRPRTRTRFLRDGTRATRAYRWRPSPGARRPRRAPRRAAPRRRAAPKKVFAAEPLFGFKEALLCVRKAPFGRRRRLAELNASAKSPAAHTAPPRVPRASSSRRRAPNTAWRAPGGRRRSSARRRRRAERRLQKGIRGPTCRGDRREAEAEFRGFFCFVRATRSSSPGSVTTRGGDATARLAGRRAASVSMLSAALRTRPLANARDARSVSRAATRAVCFPRRDDGNAVSRFRFRFRPATRTKPSLARRTRRRSPRKNRTSTGLPLAFSRDRCS